MLSIKPIWKVTFRKLLEYVNITRTRRYSQKDTYRKYLLVVTVFRENLPPTPWLHFNVSPHNTATLPKILKWHPQHLPLPSNSLVIHPQQTLIHPSPKPRASFFLVFNPYVVRWGKMKPFSFKTCISGLHRHWFTYFIPAPIIFQYCQNIWQKDDKIFSSFKILMSIKIDEQQDFIQQVFRKMSIAPIFDPVFVAGLNIILEKSRKLKQHFLIG